MAKVQFKMGLSSAYTELEIKDTNTFYYTTDDKVLYLGNDRIGADPSIEATVKSLQSTVETLNGADSVSGSVKQQIKAAVNALKSDVIGNLEDLSTTVKDKVVSAINSLKTDLDAANENISDLSGKIGDTTSLATTSKEVVGAINELSTKVQQVTSSEAVEVSEKEVPEGDASKSYEIKQGGVIVGTINIPKDKFVQKAEIKTLTETEEEHEPGTYIILTIANEAEGSSKLWIDVKSLVDTYEADNASSNVTVTVADHKIKANINTGAITDTELAADAVTTEKIANENVTKAKLASDVAASLTKADSALQEANITDGETNGTFKVNEKEVKVAGLQDLAYKTEASLGLGDLAKKNEADLGLDEYAKTADLGDLASANKTTLLGELDEKYDAIGAASSAQSAAQAYADTQKTAAVTEAKQYVDSELTWGTIA